MTYSEVKMADWLLDPTRMHALLEEKYCEASQSPTSLLQEMQYYIRNKGGKQ